VTVSPSAMVVVERPPQPTHRASRSSVMPISRDRAESAACRLRRAHLLCWCITPAAFLRNRFPSRGSAAVVTRQLDSGHSPNCRIPRGIGDSTRPWPRAHRLGTNRPCRFGLISSAGSLGFETMLQLPRRAQAAALVRPGADFSTVLPGLSALHARTRSPLSRPWLTCVCRHRCRHTPLLDS